MKLIKYTALGIGCIILSVNNCVGQNGKTYVTDYQNKVVSSIIFYDDSFEINYAFPPQNYFRKNDTILSPLEFTHHKVDKPLLPSGSGVRKCSGIWSKDISDNFLSKGWDFPYVDDYSNDSVSFGYLHLTSKDGTPVKLKFFNGNVAIGFISSSYYPGLEVLFLDNMYGLVYRLKNTSKK